MPSPIISLTTIPSRIEHIQPCVESLVAQGLPVYLWVAKSEKFRGGKVLESIPDELLSSGAHISVVEDRGPITKLLPALEAGHESVITADDDHIYSEGWARGLIERSSSFPGSVVCYRGRTFGEDRTYGNSKVVTNVFRIVPLVTNVSGALYQRDFFGDEIFTEWEEWPLNDDIVISAHLKRRGVRMVVVPFPSGCSLERLSVAYIAPLGDINIRGNQNDIGLQKVFWK